MYDILFPHGTYKEETTTNWLFGLFMRNPAVVYDNIRTVHENEAHTAYWNQIESGPEDFKNVRGTNAFWGGWYDLFLVGTIGAFEGYNTMSDPAVRYTSKITIDPLGHCLDFETFFTEDVVLGRTGLVLSQMFETYGIHPVVRNNIKNITFYVMSSNDTAGKEAGQYWTSLEQWPTPVMMDYYLHADKSARLTPPQLSDRALSTSWVHEPSNPVPTLGGNNLCPDIGGSIPCGPMDQTVADSRSDILVFETEILEEPLYLTGPLFATLYVSSDAIDTDFMVKVSDVYPTGEARLIQDNALRMRWREGGLNPVYMEKGEVYKIEINIWNTSFVIAPGHSLRFTVASSNWPRFSVNPNNGILLVDEKYPGENITATNSLFHSLKYPSKFSLPVVRQHQLPKVNVIKEVQVAYPDITTDMTLKFAEVLRSKIRNKDRA